MKNLFLIKDPEIDSVDMQTLVGIANAIEQEAVRRYAMLADLMERQGEAPTAAAFRVMHEEEQKHIGAVGRWAEKLGQRVPEPGAYEWQLPEELSTSWDDVSGSTLLTPYRAFAIAVQNEQRAFHFYTYLAARAVDERVMKEAEKMAVEELHHAALLRRFRRRAWHRERGTARTSAIGVASPQALEELIALNEAQIARAHHELEARLRLIGDDQSARLLEELSRVPPRVEERGASAVGDSPKQPANLAPGEQDPVRLLIQAQQPLETFSETLEGIMRTTEGELFARAEAAMVDVVKRLSRLSLQTGKRMQQETIQPVQAEPSA